MFHYTGTPASEFESWKPCNAKGILPCPTAEVFSWLDLLFTRDRALL